MANVLTDDKNNLLGIPSFDTLDVYLQGFQGGNIYVFGGERNVGKTALIVSLVNKLLENNTPLFVFSLSDTETNFVCRLISNRSSVTGERITSGGLNDEEWRIVKESVENSRRWPIYMSDAKKRIPSVYNIISAIQKAVDLGAKIVFIDDIQKVEPWTKGFEYKIMANFMAQLRQLAKQRNIPIVLTSSLNLFYSQIKARGGNTKRGKRPKLSDLYGEGVVEDASDVVIFIRPSERYELFKDVPEEMIELVIEKNSVGNLGMAILKFNRAFSQVLASP